MIGHSDRELDAKRIDFDPRHARGRSRRRDAVWLSGLVAALLLGCDEGPVREATVLRLDARWFGAAEETPHAGVARIGEVVRPVPYPRTESMSPIARSSSAHRGRMRTIVTIPATARRFPRSAFSLSTLIGVGNAPDAALTVAGARAFPATALRIDRGWRVLVSPREPERAKLSVVVPSAKDDTRSLLQLRAIAPMPRRLESRPFDLAAGSTITLAYGVVQAPRVPRGTRVCFRATLDCAWAWQRTPVDECVRVEEAARHWRDAEIPVRLRGRACRLVLATSSDAPDMGDAVWAVPQVRATVPDDPGAHPNVILISLDTLRADHLSGYGYPRPTSPSLDDLVIGRGTTFTAARTTYPMTNWAHLSLFTGVYPAALPAGGVLPAEAALPMLTELLRDAGFTTLGFTEDALVSREYGFGFGFDELTELHPDPVDRARLVVAKARAALSANRNGRFFLFLHTYKVHGPYRPSPPYQAIFRTPVPNNPRRIEVPAKFKDARDAYDQSIRELDDVLVPLLTDLDRSGLARRTLLVVLSDHGEAFGEHGVVGHGLAPQWEALAIPLVFRGPGIVAGQRVATPVSIVDVAPTILEWLGLPVPASMQGRSLYAALVGRAIASRPLFFEWSGGRNRGARVGQAKLLRSGDRVVFRDLAADPLELRPSIDAAPPPSLARALDAYEADGAQRRAELATAELPSVAPDVGEALRALGYVR